MHNTDMAFDTFIIKSKVAVTLDADTGTTVKPIMVHTPYIKQGYRVLNEYVEVSNLKAVSWIHNIEPVPFPVFELEDTDSKQLLHAINLEWKSERIQMDIVLSVDSNSTWQRIAAYSLLNSNPYPYREYSLGDHSLGDNAMLGIQIRNVGFGLLQNGNLGSDRVTVYADIARHITIEKVIDSSTKVANTITSTPSIIANSNIARSGITFLNNTTTNVFIDTVSTVTASSYLVKLEPGDYWEPPTQNYTGNYYGVVVSGSIGIEIREFV